jgi:hypothetical protein
MRKQIKESTKHGNQGGMFQYKQTWVHDVLKHVDDSGDQRKAIKTDIIEHFCIAEVVKCFVVQVWMARVLGEKRKRNEGKERDLMREHA